MSVLYFSGCSPVFDSLQCDAGGFGAEWEGEVELQALLRSLSLRTLAALWIWIKMGARARGKTQMDGVLQGNDERQRTLCKQMEQRCQTPLSRKGKLKDAQCKRIKMVMFVWHHEEDNKLHINIVIIFVKLDRHQSDHSALTANPVVQHSNSID